MSSKLKLIICFTVIIGFLLNSPINIGLANQSFVFKLKAENAGYGDLDNDSVEDDIFIDFSIHYNTINDDLILDVFIIIVTPDNQTFELNFSEEMKDDGSSFLEYNITALNTVTVGGWYTAYIYGTLLADDRIKFSSDVIIFDPPEAGNGNPG